MLIHLFPILTYLAIIYLYFKKTPILFYGSFLIVMAQFPNLLSTAYLDNGSVFMYEIGEISEESNSAYVLLFFHLIMLFIIQYVAILFGYGIRKSNQAIKPPEFKLRYIRIVVVIILLLAILLNINVIISGSPLWVYGVNKNNFWNISELTLLQPVSSQTPIFGLLLGMFNGHIKIKKDHHTDAFLINISLVLLFVYLIMLGHKFGQLIMLVYMFYVPTLIRVHVSANKFRHALIKFFFIAMLLMYLVFQYFSNKYGEWASQMIFDRIFASEGQLSHVFINRWLQNDTSFASGNIFKELAMVLGLDDSGAYGLVGIQSNIMSPEIYALYSGMSVNLSQGYLAYLIYIFDNLFLVVGFHIIFSCLVAVVICMFLRSMFGFKYIQALIYLKLFMSLHTFYVQGYLNVLISPKTFVLILIAMILWLSKKPTAAHWKE